MQDETEFICTWLTKHVHVMSHSDLMDYVDNFHHKMDGDMWFAICAIYKDMDGEMYLPLFAKLCTYFPIVSYNQVSTLTMKQTINLLNVLLGDEQTEIMCKKLVHTIITAMYNERYENHPPTSIGVHLPRERKGMDRRTHIAKVLATNYYHFYTEKNKENDWDDIHCHQEYKKGDVMKMYRKDCVYLTNKYTDAMDDLVEYPELASTQPFTSDDIQEFVNDLIYQNISGKF
jgi:hypothetical protein